MALRHWPQRVAVQTFLAWLVSSAALAAVADAAAPHMGLQEMLGVIAAYTVTLAGAIVALYLRWIRNAGRSVDRHPCQRDRDAPALGRIETTLSGLRHGQQQLQQSVGDVRKRVARIEGTLAARQGD